MCVLASLHIYWHRSGCKRCSEISPKYPCKVFIAKKRSPVTFDCYVILVAVSHLGVSFTNNERPPASGGPIHCKDHDLLLDLRVPSPQSLLRNQGGCAAFVHRFATPGDLLQKGWTWRHLTSPFSFTRHAAQCAIPCDISDSR